jgi:hypothetical protein
MKTKNQHNKTIAYHNKIAYLQGKEAKHNGYEINSNPYKNIIAEWYWLQGYNDKTVTNFSTSHPKTK